MNKLILLLIANLCILTLHAQFNIDYSPIILRGPIPKEIIENVKEKKEVNIKTSSEELSGKQKQEFYTVFSYAIKNYFQSGYIYFNDTFTSYLTRVVHEINKTQNIKGIKIYPSKVDDANALSWQDGTIFFNTRLLTWVDNEAQLAFIICHEISHYTKHHSMKEFQFTHSNNKEDVFDKGNEFDKILSTLSFSRTQEIDADETGFDLFSKTKYSKVEAVNAMKNIGKISEDEYTSYLDIKDIFYVDSTNVTACKPDSAELANREKSEERSAQDNANDDGIENYSTHPKVAERVDNIQKLLAGKDSTGSLFIVSQNEFSYLKTLSRFENIEQLYNKMDYLTCLYRITQLKREYPENKYLHIKAASCMYWLVWYKQVNTLDKFSTSHKYKTPYTEFACTIKGLTQDELGVLSLQHIQHELLKYPKDEELQIMNIKLLKLMDDSKSTQVTNNYIDSNPNGKYIYHAKQIKKSK